MSRVLSIHNLQFAFAEELLSDINLEVDSTELILINGKSGCGKTTLLRLIYGEIGDEQQSKKIHLSGRQEEEPYQWKQSDWIGFVQQDPEMQICTNRIEDEIRFGLENLELDSTEIEERISFYLKKLGLYDRRQQSVHGLSGGQKQRLILASILAMQPKLILLDEPLAQLDHLAATDFIHFLDQIRHEQACAFIVVEHRTDQLKPIASQSYTMVNGILHQFKPYPEQYRNLHLKSDSNSQLIAVEHLSFKHNQIEILKDISFKVTSGEIVALLGINGSGKTTLIQCIAKLLSYDGNVERSKRFGIVFQNPDLMLIENSVEQEISNQGIIEHLDLLKQTKQHPLILSKGQRLRTAVGSILDHEMDVLILDEPTSGQDITHINQMLHAIENCNIKSLLFCTHDLQLAKTIANRFLILDDGKLIFDGNPQQLSQSKINHSIIDFFK